MPRKSVAEEQLSLFGDPPAGKRKTSRAAAKSLTRKQETLPTLRMAVLRSIERAGKTGRTCDELEQQLSLPHQTCSARVYELHTKSLIKDSGRTRKTRSGRSAIVWRVA